MRSVPCIQCLTAIVLTLVIATAQAQEVGYIQGLVTDADTRLPVANATVQVLIESETDPGKKLRRGLSDEQGRYRIELPIGHGWAFTFKPPVGYVSAKPNDIETFATTAKQPVFTKNYQVRRGVSFPVQLQTDDGIPIPAKSILIINRVRGDKAVQNLVEFASEGTATATLPDATGLFQVYCHVPEPSEASGLSGVSMEFESGFDVRDVRSEIVRPDSLTCIVSDAHGRTATFKGCDVTVNEMTVKLLLKLAKKKKSDKQIVAGRIVDQRGNGIDRAAVQMVFSELGGGGSAMSGEKVFSNATGDFSIHVPKLAPNGLVSFVVTHPGFGGRDTLPRPLQSSESESIDIGEIKLEPAASIRVRVVDIEGNPLQGAIVEPLNGYAWREQVARTNIDGECQLVDLMPGDTSVSIRFGQSGLQTKVPLLASENELIVLKVKPYKLLAPASPNQAVLKIGTPAPALSIREWSDGKTHSLDEFRGQVVVIDFWGIWCGPCLHAMQAMQALESRYKDRGVVFISVHTADEEMSVIQRMLVAKKWSPLTGIDAGEDIIAGATVNAYGVKGFPTLIVIDQQGRIAYSSGDIPDDPEAAMKIMQTAAEAASIPWPIDKDASESEVNERMTKLQIAIFGEQIEKVVHSNSSTKP